MKIKKEKQTPQEKFMQFAKEEERKHKEAILYGKSGEEVHLSKTKNRGY